MTETTFTPVTLGPTWQKVPDWESRPYHEQFVLPETTLGWQIIKWVEDNLLSDEGKPFLLTFEQKRFILWWYAVDDRGRFTYRNGVLQRLKGWGKDPLAAVLAAVEFVGPCRFSHWALKADPKADIVAGDPVGMEHPRAWIQIAAVSKDQTRNTMKLFPGLFTKSCMQKHNINMGKEIIYAHGGARTIEAVTSSPRALEGGRPTFVICNETHHWLENNEGHAMQEVIGRNLTKAKGGQARSLAITNAYAPSEKSIAQMQREAWENEVAGLTIATGVLYDSIEAPPEARMAWGRNEDGSVPSDDEVRAYIGAVVRSVRGDAVWLDVDGIVDTILDVNNSPSTSRRFYYNQVVAAEDTWLHPDAAKASVHPAAEDARQMVGADQLRAGWSLVMPDEPVVMFGDGSKNDDSTGLMGCRLSDGYVFTVGVWQKPAGEAGKLWHAPRDAVSNRVHEAMERFNVVAFWFDPSHTKDDDGSRYWDELVDSWHQKYKDKLQLWATKTGTTQHAVMWDMASPARATQFAAAAERYVEETEIEGPEGWEPSFKIDGHPAFMDHLRNAKEYPTRDGLTSLFKGGRESSKKIDLAVCAVGARMLRALMVNVGLTEEKGPKQGKLWGIGPGEPGRQDDVDQIAKMLGLPPRVRR